MTQRARPSRSSDSVIDCSGSTTPKSSAEAFGQLSVVPGYTASIAQANRTDRGCSALPPSPAALAPADRRAAGRLRRVDRGRARPRGFASSPHPKLDQCVEGGAPFAVPTSARWCRSTHRSCWSCPVVCRRHARTWPWSWRAIGYDQVRGALDGASNAGSATAAQSCRATPPSGGLAHCRNPIPGCRPDPGRAAADGVARRRHPGSTTIALADLPARLPEIRLLGVAFGAEVTVVVCQRPRTVAASLLERAGISVRLVASRAAPATGCQPHQPTANRFLIDRSIGFGSPPRWIASFM